MTVFLVGVLLGAAQIGAQTYRYIQTLVGNKAKVLGTSIVLAVVYWFSVSLVIQKDFLGYLGFACGAAAISVLLAHKNAVSDKFEHLEHPD